MGSVPPLCFVLDKEYAALKEVSWLIYSCDRGTEKARMKEQMKSLTALSGCQVENLLKIADYGPSDDSEKPVLNEKDAE